MSLKLVLLAAPRTEVAATMLQPQTTQLPEALATGLLAKKPLAHLLVYALERALTGTFELVDENRERVHIAVVDGLLARVSTSVPVTYLGHLLYEEGIFDGAQLSASLAEVATSKRLHGQVLLAMGLVSPGQLADGLKEQRARKLLHAFELSSRATFAFYPGVDLVRERPNDVPATDPLPHVWRGVSLRPSWDHVRATMATVDGRRLRLVGGLERLGLRPKEIAATDHLRRTPSTVAQLAALAGMDPRAADLLAYFLVITKLAEIVERVGVSAAPPPAPARPASSAPNKLGVSLSSGEYVRKMSFSMRAVTGDQNPLRIPSPLPGRLSAVAARTIPANGRLETVEAEHSLAQAEMHFVLGERVQAIVHARRALAEAPAMPEALSFLAYLEGLGLGEGQEEFLEDLLKMADSALAKDDTCRRGRYYRAELRKRAGDHAGAIRDLRVAVTHDPDDEDALRALKVYEQKVREGRIVLAPVAGPGKHAGIFERRRGK